MQNGKYWAWRHFSGIKSDKERYRNLVLLAKLALESECDARAAHSSQHITDYIQVVSVLGDQGAIDAREHVALGDLHKGKGKYRHVSLY